MMGINSVILVVTTILLLASICLGFALRAVWLELEFQQEINTMQRDMLTHLNEKMHKLEASFYPETAFQRRKVYSQEDGSVHFV